MSVEKLEREGEELLRVSTPTWEAEIVVSNNANLIRLRHSPSGLDVLRTPSTLAELRRWPERYGMPLQFPPGRLNGGRFRWNGREHFLPVNEPERNCSLHGLLHGDPWRLASAKEDAESAEAVLAVEFGPAHRNYKGFPYEFRIELTYAFKPACVEIVAKVSNLGAGAMPCGLGYHTAFRLPFGPASKEKEERCRVAATTNGLQQELTASRRLPTGRLVPLAPELHFEAEEGCEIGTKRIGTLIPLESKRGFRGATLESPADRAKIVYEAGEEFHLLALWNDGGGEGFICVEPLTWMSDAPNLNAPPEVSGLRKLAAGETWTCSTKTSVALEPALKTLETSDKDSRSHEHALRQAGRTRNLISQPRRQELFRFKEL